MPCYSLICLFFFSLKKFQKRANKSAPNKVMIVVSLDQGCPQTHDAGGLVAKSCQLFDILYNAALFLLYSKVSQLYVHIYPVCLISLLI